MSAARANAGRGRSRCRPSRPTPHAGRASRIRRRADRRRAHGTAQGRVRGARVHSTPSPRAPEVPGAATRARHGVLGGSDRRIAPDRAVMNRTGAKSHMTVTSPPPGTTLPRPSDLRRGPRARPPRARAIPALLLSALLAVAGPLSAAPAAATPTAGNGARESAGTPTPAPTTPTLSGETVFTLSPIANGTVRAGEGLAVSVSLQNGTDAAHRAGRGHPFARQHAAARPRRARATGSTAARAARR